MALALPMIKMRAIFSDVASQHITESMGITRLKSNALKKAQAHNANMPQTKMAPARAPGLPNLQQKHWNSTILSRNTDN
jgi:hypothetical protein